MVSNVNLNYSNIYFDKEWNRTIIFWECHTVALISDLGRRTPHDAAPR